MLRRRQLIELAVEQLTAVIASVLQQQAPKDAKLAQAMTHTDYTLQTLTALLMHSHPVDLITERDKNAVKQKVVESVNMAIMTRTNVMMSPDKSGRRYRLQSALTRFLLLQAIQHEIEWYIDQALELKQGLRITVDGQNEHIFRLRNKKDMMDAINHYYKIHPFINIHLSLKP